MSWQPIDPPVMSASLRQKIPVSLSMRVGTKKRAPSIYLIVRQSLLKGMTMLGEGKVVQVLRGEGQHAGMLRVQPDGPFPIQRLGTRGHDPVAAIRLPTPPGVRPVARKPQPVEFDHGVGWLEVTLPDWALPAERTSVMDRVPDPAAALRGRGR